MVVMVVVEHRQRFAERRRDEAVELRSNGRERGAKGLVCPLGVPLSTIYRWRGGQCSMKDDHNTSIYLQLNDYNSILEQSMTLYECLLRYTGIAMMHE